MKTTGDGGLHRASAGFEITLKYCAARIGETGLRRFDEPFELAVTSSGRMSRCPVPDKSVAKLQPSVLGNRDKRRESGGAHATDLQIFRPETSTGAFGRTRTVRKKPYVTCRTDAPTGKGSNGFVHRIACLPGTRNLGT